jgi:hypothetical protein
LIKYLPKYLILPKYRILNSELYFFTACFDRCPLDREIISGNFANTFCGGPKQLSLIHIKMQRLLQNVWKAVEGILDLLSSCFISYENVGKAGSPN